MYNNYAYLVKILDKLGEWPLITKDWKPIQPEIVIARMQALDSPVILATGLSKEFGDAMDPILWVSLRAYSYLFNHENNLYYADRGPTR